MRSAIHALRITIMYTIYVRYKHISCVLKPKASPCKWSGRGTVSFPLIVHKNSSLVLRNIINLSHSIPNNTSYLHNFLHLLLTSKTHNLFTIEILPTLTHHLTKQERKKSQTSLRWHFFTSLPLCSRISCAKNTLYLLLDLAVKLDHWRLLQLNSEDSMLNITFYYDFAWSRLRAQN